MADALVEKEGERGCRMDDAPRRTKESVSSSGPAIAALWPHIYIIRAPDSENRFSLPYVVDVADGVGYTVYGLSVQSLSCRREGSDFAVRKSLYAVNFRLMKQVLNAPLLQDITDTGPLRMVQRALSCSCL